MKNMTEFSVGWYVENEGAVRIAFMKGEFAWQEMSDYDKKLYGDVGMIVYERKCITPEIQGDLQILRFIGELADILNSGTIDKSSIWKVIPYGSEPKIDEEDGTV